jgi:AcrR family transcriptional regulator
MSDSRNHARRADAERNRTKILEAARTAFADNDAQVSMAEIARRAGVGMATLYRNYPGRRELLEALYMEEVNALCDAAETATVAEPGAAFVAWLSEFVAFFRAKHEVGQELLRDDPEGGHDVLAAGRDRVFAAGEPLLFAAQAAGAVRPNLTLAQVLEMVRVIATINADADFVQPLLQAAVDGLAPPSASGLPSISLPRS